MVSIAKDLNSRITLNDGVEMPYYGLGMYKSRSGQEGHAEEAVTLALKLGYRLLDTSEFYG